MKLNEDNEILLRAEELIDQFYYRDAIHLLKLHEFADRLDADLLIAYSYYKLEEYKEAIRIFNYIENKHGVLENSNYLKANCYLETGEYHLAEVNFRKVLDINPNTFDAFTGLGVAKECQGDPEGAKHYYEMALNLNPNSIVAQNRLKSIGARNL